jgi:hypothetical protein
MMARGGGPPGMQGRGQEGLPPPDYINPYYNGNSTTGSNPDSAPRGQDLYYASSADPAIGVIGQAIEMDERHGLPSTEEDNFARQQATQQSRGPYAQHDQPSGPSSSHLQVAGNTSVRSSGEARSPTSLYSNQGTSHE